MGIEEDKLTHFSPEKDFGKSKQWWQHEQIF